MLPQVPGKASPKHSWIIEPAHRIGAVLDDPRLGWALLAVSLLAGLSQIYFVFGNLGDESDGIATAWLMAQGKTLYVDIFTHHFPFPFTWEAGVIALFGPSIAALRLSLLLLRIVCLGVSMRLSRLHTAIGLASLAWSLMGFFCLGNMLQAYSFTAIFLASAFALGLALLTGRVNPRPAVFIAAGAFIGLSILNDPLSIFPGLALIAGFFILPLQRTAFRRSLKSGCIYAAWSILPIAVIGFISLGWLALAGSLQSFINDAVTFNSQVYSQFLGKSSAFDTIQPLFNLLGVFNRTWLAHKSPFFTITSLEDVYPWLFTGFFFRLAVIFGSLFYALRRKVKAGLFIYLFCGLSLPLDVVTFRMAPFALLAIFLSMHLLTAAPGALASGLIAPEAGARWMRLARRLGSSALVGGALLVGCMGIWLALRGGQYLVQHNDRLTYQANYGPSENAAAQIEQLTCGAPDVRVLVYPQSSQLYYLSGSKPVSEYIYMFPWVARVGQQKVIDQLQQTPKVLVKIDLDAVIWGYPLKDYARDLVDYLKSHYIQTSKDIFRSPQLVQSCP